MDRRAFVPYNPTRKLQPIKTMDYVAYVDEPIGYIDEPVMDYVREPQVVRSRDVYEPRSRPIREYYERQPSTRYIEEPIREQRIPRYRDNVFTEPIIERLPYYESRTPRKRREPIVEYVDDYPRLERGRDRRIETVIEERPYRDRKYVGY